VDRQGPLLNLDAVEVLAEFPQQRVRVKGFLSDRSRMVRFLLVGRRMSLPLEREWEFREEVALMAGLTAISFEAQDAAGNVTRGEIALTLTSNDPPRIQKGEPGLPWLPRWAFLNPSATVSDFPTVRATDTDRAGQWPHPTYDQTHRTHVGGPTTWQLRCASVAEHPDTIVRQHQFSRIPRDGSQLSDSSMNTVHLNRLVSQLLLLTVVVQPSELSIDPKAHAAGMSNCVLVAAYRSQHTDGKDSSLTSSTLMKLTQHPTASDLQIPWREFPQNAGCLPPQLPHLILLAQKGGRRWKYSKGFPILPRAAGSPLMPWISTFESCGTEISRKIVARNLDFFVQFSKLNVSRLRACDLRAGIAIPID
jgi:hypothetical protein